MESTALLVTNAMHDPAHAPFTAQTDAASPAALVSTHTPDPDALPLGIRWASGHGRIKRSRADLALVISDADAAIAGVFTRNPLRAACAARSHRNIELGRARGVVLNSGNANAMTGARGTQDDEILAATVARAAGCTSEAIFTASTGPIGVALQPERFVDALAALPGGATRTPDAVMGFAEAILTTDTCTKVAHATVRLADGRKVRVLGVAKGSGMIHPDMATTLAVVTTDAGVPHTLLQAMLRRTVETTFNAITVDGDTSTNDSLFYLASGAAGAVSNAPDLAALEAAMHAVTRSLAIQVAADGEGATHLLEIEVKGTPDDASARSLARGACRGALFKCSVLAGEPGGWGRLCAAIGQEAARLGLALVPERVSITAQGVPILAHGAVVMPPREIDPNDPSQAHAKHSHGDLVRRLREPTVRWVVEVGDGPGRGTAWGCDLSYDYVRINADEAPTIEVRPDGGVSRNLSLGAYSPTLKHQLLVDGLGYVRKFVGMRVGIVLLGSMPRKPERVAAFAQDLELVADAGIRPFILLPDRAAADALATEVASSAVRVTEVASPLPVQIGALLDRGHVVSWVAARTEPSEIVALSIKLGLGKLLVLGDEQGLHDASGLVPTLTPEQALSGLDRGRFHTHEGEFLAFARHGAKQSLPALHLIDGRLPHALVAELFTDQGIGTLVTRQAI